MQMVAVNANENGRLNNCGNGGIVALKAYENGGILALNAYENGGSERI